MLMDPSTYSFQDDIFTAQVLPVWSLSPDVNFDLTVLEFLSEPLTPPPVLPRSAFHKYVRPDRCFQPASSAAPVAGNKMHKRLIAMLRNMKTPPETRESSGAAPESSRGFRHMIRERQRREKLSQSYADLYAMLCSRSKGDKNSIVQSAVMYIRELKGVKEELHKKNEELKAKILGIDAFSTEGIKVKFEVANPNSGLDSMIAALRRLQSMHVKAKAIRSDLSTGGLATTMTIQTKMAACEVEKEIEEALRDVERESYGYDPLFVFPGNNNNNNINTCIENVFSHHPNVI